MKDFNEAFDALIGNEGGYSNNAADPGGETMWGITKRVAVASGYMGQMKDLPRETAKQIAKKNYWLLSALLTTFGKQPQNNSPASLVLVHNSLRKFMIIFILKSKKWSFPDRNLSSE